MTWEVLKILRSAPPLRDSNLMVHGMAKAQGLLKASQWLSWTAVGEKHKEPFRFLSEGQAWPLGIERKCP